MVEKAVILANHRRLGLTQDATIAACISAITMILMFYRLDSVPAFFYDEGYFGQIAKNFALYGQYGSIFYEGYVPAQLSVGPTVLLPVSAVYKIFGVGIWQSRLIVGIAGACASLLIYYLGREMRNPLAGLLAWAFTLPLFMQYRLLLGEVPAICFLLAGVWCWRNAMRTNATFSAIAAGLAFGMMLVSKPQMLLTAPAFAVTIFANWYYYRCWSLRFMFWMLVMIPLPEILSILFQATNLGWNTYWSYILFDLTQTSGSTVFPRVWGLALRSEGAAEVVRILLLGVPCLLWALTWCRERSGDSLIKLWLITTAITTLIWFVLLSPGWNRYRLLADILIFFFVAGVVVELLNRIYIKRRLTHASLCLILTSAAIVIILPALVFLRYMQTTPGTDVIDIAAAVQRHVAREALIETYEWPVDVLTSHRYHHPSVIVHNPRVDYYLLGEKMPPPIYEFWRNEPAYLVTGPMGLGLQAYPQPFLDQCATLLDEYNMYALYQLAEPACFDRVLQQQSNMNSR
jgi:4-amino-4-deoxy-L-arabinose transferase-like glycosyltransferase